MPSPILPKWAINDVPDPISLQDNVAVPPPEKELEGWHRGEKPNRQWLNWLHRQTYLNLEYIQNRINFTAQYIVPVWTGLSGGTFIFNDNHFFYVRIGEIVFFNCHVNWDNNANTSAITMTNLPYISKAAPITVPPSDFVQSVNVIRGAGQTFSNMAFPTPELAGLIDEGTTILKLWKYVDTAGVFGTQLLGIAGSGQLIINGHYIIEAP